MKKIKSLIIAMLVVYCAFLGYQINELKKDMTQVESEETITYVNKNITGFSTDLTKVIDSVSPHLVRVNAFNASASYIGSGVVYSVSEEETIVITNARGVKEALDISVTFNNGESTAAVIVGMDELTDLAVLSTKPLFTATAIPLGSTESLSLGEWVIAVGNNKRDDFSPSLSVGVVSALDRPYSPENQKENTYGLNMVVADLKISAGLTGGAVINMQGELIGIPSSKLSDTDAVIVPVEEIVEVVRMILEYQEVVRPVMGIATQKVSGLTAYQKSHMNIQLDQIEGLYINSVKRNSACDQAQIQAGDILLEFNGTKVNSYSTLRTLLYACKPQEIVEVTILRKTETMKVMVTLQ